MHATALFGAFCFARIRKNLIHLESKGRRSEFAVTEVARYSIIEV